MVSEHIDIDVEIPESPEPPQIGSRPGRKPGSKNKPKTHIGSGPSGEGPNTAAGTTKVEMQGTFYGIFTALALACRVDPPWEEKDFSTMAAAFMVIAKSFPEQIMRLLPILKPVLFFVECGKKVAKLAQAVRQRRERETVAQAEAQVQQNSYVYPGPEGHGGFGPDVGTPKI